MITIDPESIQAKAFYAVLDAHGEMVDRAKSFEEAADRALHGSAAVFVDKSVEGARSRANDDISVKARNKAAMKAAQLSAIPTVTGAWDGMSLKEAQSIMRPRARVLYKALLNEVADTVHLGRKGGIGEEMPAKLFNPRDRNGILRENQKTSKILEGADTQYASRGVSFLPHAAAFKDPFDLSLTPGTHTFCAGSVAECRATCLVFTGQRKMESGAYAHSWLYSQLLLEEPDAVLALIRHSILEWTEMELANGVNLFYRLNVFSDIPWEIIAPDFVRSVVYELRQKYQLRGRPEEARCFYDYTKIAKRQEVVDDKGQTIYDLTFSFTGYPQNTAEFVDIINETPGSAKRCAVVFLHKAKGGYAGDPGSFLKTRYKGKQQYDFTFFGEKVWNGDLSDIRPLDPEHVKVVGLAYKPAMYKILSDKKTFELRAFIPVEQLDALQPRFLVRVTQPDPDAPPVVCATQDREARTFLPVLE